MVGLRTGHWVPDSEATHCAVAGCWAPFTAWRRRHHCRRCGLVFCHAHCRQSLPLTADCEFAGASAPDAALGRVCDLCFSFFVTRVCGDNAPNPGPGPESSMAEMDELGEDGEFEFDDCEDGAVVSFVLRPRAPTVYVVPSCQRLCYEDVLIILGFLPRRDLRTVARVSHAFLRLATHHTLDLLGHPRPVARSRPGVLRACASAATVAPSVVCFAALSVARPLAGPALRAVLLPLAYALRNALGPALQLVTWASPWTIGRIARFALLLLRSLPLAPERALLPLFVLLARLHLRLGVFLTDSAVEYCVLRPSLWLLARSLEAARGLEWHCGPELPLPLPSEPQHIGRQLVWIRSALREVVADHTHSDDAANDTFILVPLPEHPPQTHPSIQTVHKSTAAVWVAPYPVYSRGLSLWRPFLRVAGLEVQQARGWPMARYRLLVAFPTFPPQVVAQATDIPSIWMAFLQLLQVLASRAPQRPAEILQDLPATIASIRSSAFVSATLEDDDDDVTPTKEREMEWVDCLSLQRGGHV